MVLVVKNTTIRNTYTVLLTTGACQISRASGCLCKEYFPSSLCIICCHSV